MSYHTLPSRPKLLLLNYACSPYHGSEPGVGWNRAIEAAKYCDTWVICEGHEFEEDIRRYLRENGPIDGLRFTFVHKPAWERRLARVPWCYFLSYNLWQRRALRAAKELDRQVDFDLMHHQTMCSYREPGYAWQLGKPFISGPAGGTQNYPWRFLPMAGWRGAIKELSRSVANWLQLRTSRRVRAAAKVANPFLVTSSSVAEVFQSACGVSSEVVPDCGVRQMRPAPREIDRDRTTLRILWSGNLIPLKALPVLLHALARLDGQVDFELRILGDGYCRCAWEALASRLKLSTRVRFLGRLPHAEALAQRSWADVFVFTSLRDSSGNVVVEAFADGLPVVSFDHQGVRDIVDETCGIKVPVTTPEEAYLGFAEALRRLANDADLRDQLGRGGLERARIYDWTNQGRRMAAIYRSVLGSRVAWDDEQVPRQPWFGHRDEELPRESALMGVSC